MSNNKNFEPANFDSMKCIWMSSKTVEYKLCDQNFDCDNCAFDKIMRNINPDNQNPGSFDNGSIQHDIYKIKTEILKSIKYSKEYHYLNNSIVLKYLFDNSYYLGLDRSAYLLLDNLTGYEFLNSSQVIKKGEPFLRLSGDWGETVVLSPIDFTMVDKLNHKADEIKNNIWLCLIETESNAITESQLSEKDYECTLDHLMVNFYEFENKYSFLGARMKDGGTEVKFLYQAIGIQKYKALIKSLFSNEC